jgi:hypothetical protein
MEQWFGIGLKPGFVLSWAGKNQVLILKPALITFVNNKNISIHHPPHEYKWVSDSLISL